MRTADAIDPASRTLLAEIDVDNRSGELLPGSLAQVHFKTPTAGPTFIVPTAALIFRRDGMELATVVDGDVAHLVHVVIGEDDGATVQIVSGLNPGDQIIQDPPDSLIDGEKVRWCNRAARLRRRENCRPMAAAKRTVAPVSDQRHPGGVLAARFDLGRRPVGCCLARLAPSLPCSPCSLLLHRLQAGWPQLQSPRLQRACGL